MKLNLGCGNNRKEGYVNVDREAACAPDQVVDLEQIPWPWPDDVAEEVVMSHVLEHLGRDVKTYFAIMRELWRICRPGALVRIVVPHPRHDSFLNDPTHVRPITPEGLELFSQTKNREWAGQGIANSPLGLYLGIDFAIESANMVPAEPWRTRFAKREIDAGKLMEAARQFNNVIQEIAITLRAVKAPAG